MLRKTKVKLDKVALNGAVLRFGMSPCLVKVRQRRRQMTRNIALSTEPQGRSESGLFRLLWFNYFSPHLSLLLSNYTHRLQKVTNCGSTLHLFLLRHKECRTWSHLEAWKLVPHSSVLLSGTIKFNIYTSASKCEHTKTTLIPIIARPKFRGALCWD